MSGNVKGARVNETLYAEHKKSSRTITSHPELCGGRGTRTHKPLRTTVFKTANQLLALSLLAPQGPSPLGKSGLPPWSSLLILPRPKKGMAGEWQIVAFVAARSDQGTVVLGAQQRLRRGGNELSVVGQRENASGKQPEAPSVPFYVDQAGGPSRGSRTITGVSIDRRPA
jgi:hypothetical protein